MRTAWTLFWLFAVSNAWAAEAVVEIDLVTAGRVPATKPHEWARALAEVGFAHAAVRSQRADDQLQIETRGTQASPVYHVTGYLSEDGNILLPPGVRFGLLETGRLSKWVQESKLDGPQADRGEQKAFGLTSKRLEAVYDDLSQVVAVSTKGVDPNKAVDLLASTMKYRVVIQRKAREALMGDDPVRDELQGLSTGTALAAALRPAGLVLRPRFQDGQLEFAVLDSRDAGDNWPIGWLPSKSPGKLIPKLFENAKTQEARVPLTNALGEISQRLDTPFLLDHNGMAAHRIELSTLKVDMTAGQTYYGRILRGVLRQAELKYELRVDENKKPFLWITTSRP